MCLAAYKILYAIYDAFKSLLKRWRWMGKMLEVVYDLDPCSASTRCFVNTIQWSHEVALCPKLFIPHAVKIEKKKTVWERHFYLLHSENRYSFVLNEHMCQYHLCNGLSSPLLKLNVVSVDKVLLTRSWKKPSFNPLMSVRDTNCDIKTLYGQWTVIYATVNRQPWPSTRNEQQNEGTKSQTSETRNS